jgi:hypothetical protein
VFTPGLAGMLLGEFRRMASSVDDDEPAGEGKPSNEPVRGLSASEPRIPGG